MNWAFEDAIIPADVLAWDRFGFWLDLDGDVLAVGAPGLASSAHPGAVYVYRFDGADWVFEDKVTPDDGANGDRCSRSGSRSESLRGHQATIPCKSSVLVLEPAGIEPASALDPI